VLARRSASARRRENGNPALGTEKYGFLLEFIPVKTGAGMTKGERL
jgi:hypothetical protein